MYKRQIWYVALWFHLTHGFWSAIQTIGWNNTIWMNRWECISKIVATVICGLFAIITIIFFLNGVGAVSYTHLTEAYPHKPAR